MVTRAINSTNKDYCIVCARKRKFPYWDEQKAVELVRTIAAKLGRTPRKYELPETLRNQIANHHGNYDRFMRRNGFSLYARPRGYWKKWSNLEKELLPLCKRLNRFPSSKELYDLGYCLLLPAVSRFGGTKAVARRLGFEMVGALYAEDGHAVYSYYERVTDDLLFAHGVPHKREPRITKDSKCRADFLVDNVFIECLGYADKKDERGRSYRERWVAKRALYESVGARYIALYPRDFRERASGVRKKLEKLIQAHKSRPSPTLSLDQILRPIGFYAEWENLEKDLLPVCRELGRFPTVKELESRQLTTLSIYMRNYHGGSFFVSKRLGFGLPGNAPGSLKSFALIGEILRPICQELGRMPTAAELRSLKFGRHTNIVGALYEYHGGLVKVAERLGVPNQRSAKTKG